MVTNSVLPDYRTGQGYGPDRSSFRTQVGYADILVRVILHKSPVAVNPIVAEVDDLHALLVAHGQTVFVDDVPQVIQDIGGLFQQNRIARRYRTEFLRTEIGIG